MRSSKTGTFSRKEKIELMAELIRKSPWKDPVEGSKWEVTMPLVNNHKIDESNFDQLHRTVIPTVSGSAISYTLHLHDNAFTDITLEIYYRTGLLKSQDLASMIVSIIPLSNIIDYAKIAKHYKINF